MAGLYLLLFVFVVLAQSSVTMPGWKVSISVDVQNDVVGIYSAGFSQTDGTTLTYEMKGISAGNDFIAVHATSTGSDNSGYGMAVNVVLTSPDNGVTYSKNFYATANSASGSNGAGPDGQWYCSSTWTPLWNEKGFDPTSAFAKSRDWKIPYVLFNDGYDYIWTSSALPAVVVPDPQDIYCVFNGFLGTTNTKGFILDAPAGTPSFADNLYLCDNEYAQHSCDNIFETTTPYQCVSGSCVLPCDAKKADASGCGYKGTRTVLNTPREISFLRTEFEIPVLNEQKNLAVPDAHNTFLCMRTVLDIPKCDAKATPGDAAFVRIPNVADFEVPCHSVNLNFYEPVPGWAWDAFLIPSVSGLRSHLEFEFDEMLAGTVGNPYFGLGISHLYITQRSYNGDREAWSLDQNKYSGNFADREWTVAYPDEFPMDPCNTKTPGVTVVYDFFDTCAAKWDKFPEDSIWNAQTPDNWCYCHAPAGPPSITYQAAPMRPWTVNNSFVYGAANPTAQYFWWYGTCDGCNPSSPGARDPNESANQYIPATMIDSDGDTVPDACDRCEDWDDGLDSDGDRVPDACDKCEGYSDYLDLNNNLIPDDCDFCSNIPNACYGGSCTDGPDPRQYTCNCPAGFIIDDTPAPYNAPQFSAAVISNWAKVLAFQSPYMISNNLNSYTPANITTAVAAGELPVLFILKKNITPQQLVSFVNSFAATFESTLGSCLSCRYSTITYPVAPVVVQGFPETQITVTITPYATTMVFGFDAPNHGCVDFDECKYGCDAHSVCKDSKTDETIPFGSRLCICNATAGYHDSRILVGETPFPGCHLRN